MADSLIDLARSVHFTEGVPLSRDNPAEMRSRRPSFNELMQGLLSRAMGDDRESFRQAGQAMDVLNLTPFGALTAADETGRAVGSGDIPGAALGMMGFFPVARGPAGGIRALARRAGNENVPLTKRIEQPLDLEERTFRNFAADMEPEEFLRSEPMWSGAQRIADERGIPFAQAFSEFANTMFQRTGANRFMTPETAAKFIMAERQGN